MADFLDDLGAGVEIFVDAVTKAHEPRIGILVLDLGDVAIDVF